MILEANVEVYKLDKLMEETRALASKYKDATGQPLPVSHDLACYDAIRYLNLSEPTAVEASVDAIGTDQFGEQKYQIKGRVQFPNSKGKQQRIGQLNLDGNWNICLLVLLKDDYQSDEILAADKETIYEAIGHKKTNKRGAMTVSQFRAIAESIWKAEQSNDEVLNSQEK